MMDYERLAAHERTSTARVQNRVNGLFHFETSAPEVRVSFHLMARYDGR